MSIESPYATVLARFPSTRHETTVLGSRTAWWSYGREDAETVVVAVHGFRGDHHGLEPVVGELLGGGADYRVVSPDLPGFGESTPFIGHEHDVEGYSAWLRAFLEETGLPESAIVLGHSFGSIVVSHAAAHGLSAPLLVLVNPIAAPALSGPRGILTRLAVFYYWAGARLPEKLGFLALRSGLVVRIVSVAMTKTKDPGLVAFIHDQHDRYFSAFASRDVVLQAFRASVSHDVSEYAADIESPTLLVAADQDDITPVAAQYRLTERFARARLHVIHGVGHLIHYETPTEAASVIREAVDRGIDR